MTKSKQRAKFVLNKLFSFRNQFRSTRNLSGDVPQLKPDFQLVVEVDQLQAEVDAEGGAILAPVAEEVMNVATDERGLAAVHLADDYHLRQQQEALETTKSLTSTSGPMELTIL